MSLIYYRGLNCHLACIINIASLLGANYLNAFSALWSETDFTDEVEYNIYVSKRVFTGFKKVGIVTQHLNCDAQAEEIMSTLTENELFFTGTDMFFIPWHPVYNNFHGPHYFFAKKESANTILCFDPVYGEQNRAITPGEVLSAAFKVGRILKTDAEPQKNIIFKEATAVLRGHPKIKAYLSNEILNCRNEGSFYINTLIKQINAMINNRYLFGRFINDAMLSFNFSGGIMGENYYLKWEAVRNGLYKASILKNNNDVIDEVCSMFLSLMDEEMSIARMIINLSLPAKKQLPAS